MRKLLLSIFHLALLGGSTVLAQPVASFSQTANCNEITFIDNSSCVGCTPPITYLWDFGDGGSSTLPNPSHVFSIGNGPYDVTLTIADGLGANDDYTLQVDSANCLPTELVPDTSACGISLVGPPGFTSYSWSTGETTQSIQIQSPGQFNLWVTNANGNIGYSVFEIDSVNIENCAQITGRVFEDLNNNGIDDNEPGISGVYMRDTVWQQNSSYAITDSDGQYNLYVDAQGVHSVDVLYSPTEVFCNTWSIGEQTVPATEAYSINLPPGTMEVPDNDFGFHFETLECGTISGKVFLDENQNATEDIGENGYTGLNIYFEDSQGNYVAITQSDVDGLYSIELPMGDYNMFIHAESNNQSFYCSYTSINTQTFPLGNQGYSVTINTGSPTSISNDFGLYASPGVDAGIYSLWPDYGIVAGEDFNTGMDWKIFGTVNGSCTLRVDLPPLVSFVSAMITPTNVGSDFVEWVFTNPVTPIGTCMGITFHLDASAVAGQLLTWEASFICTSTDACPGNNYFSRTCEIQDGPAKFSATEFAPVSKIALHTGNQETGDITHDDSTFCYIINFQNVTADTARHVRIVDHISEHLDIRTISQPFSMSPHKFYILDDQTVIWEMDEIAMPDTASGYINSYSFVQYNIRMKQNLPIGTDIFNSAWVYFNREDSIMTNITKNTIVNPDGIQDSDEAIKHLHLYPNPSSDHFNLRFDSPMAGNYFISVNDVLGKNIYSFAFEHDSETILNIDGGFSPGAYFVSVSNENETFIQKLVVQ